MKASLLVLCWLMLFLWSSNAVDLGCSFSQQLSPTETYYVYNPEYPYSYRGPRSCIWSLQSDYKVNISCNLQLPWSSNCTQDRLEIQVSPTTTHRFCGDGTLSLMSEGNTMTLTLTAPMTSAGGRLLCEVRAVKRPQDSTDCECGRRNPSRIVGGTATGINEFPMMAGLVDIKSREPFCGGTIISNQYILTAGHCIANRNVSELVVLVGDHDYTTGADTNASKVFLVRQKIVHPNYVFGGQQNDIGILEIAGWITYNNQVGPVCLPFQHSPDTFGGSLVQALGWGSLEYGGGPSTVLQKVTLNVETNLACRKNYPEVSNNQICTYTKNKDSCSMDSGGPLLWENPTSLRLVLAGVINYGIACAVFGSVNCRVGAYIDWITSVTPGARYCIVE
ncbi:PREDICTED: venom serine protease 34-like [Dufourea novaeangliae]|uniref:venom serine protease 34-like n=1 Tax=Dufourea novaeangliae TaxID=178035 RepID=UPI000766E1EF|nr:PREDICTED: venom serine protease 34-like [Dufourea novaeangliae]